MCPSLGLFFSEGGESALFWTLLSPFPHIFHYLRIENAEGYVLIAVYLFIHLFIYLFVCVFLA